MDDCVYVHPVLHRAPHARLDLEHAVRANRKLGLVARLDSHLARSDRADARLVAVRIQSQRGTRVNRIDVERHILAHRHHLFGRDVGLGEGKICDMKVSPADLSD